MPPPGGTPRPVPLIAYHDIGITAWAGRSPAGDAAATWHAIHQQRRHLTCDAEHGWVGRCLAGDQEELGLDMARAVRHRLHGRVALGVGTSKGSLIAWADGAAGLHRHLPGGVNNRIAHALDLSTYLPCACAAACSTGLACLLAGADAIERGQADTALVGACEASLNPLTLAGFRNAGVLCGSTTPLAFAEPTGFAPAEGAGVFVLGRDPAPWRLVAGIRLGDAGHETHFTDPATLLTALQALWRVAPDPDLIICHATGTKAGDAYEQSGLADGPWRSIPRLLCKPWIGHALGASGAVELAAGLEAPVGHLWKLSLGFGGHLVGIACRRNTSA